MFRGQFLLRQVTGHLPLGLRPLCPRNRVNTAGLAPVHHVRIRRSRDRIARMPGNVVFLEKDLDRQDGLECNTPKISGRSEPHSSLLIEGGLVPVTSENAKEPTMLDLISSRSLGHSCDGSTRRDFLKI